MTFFVGGGQQQKTGHLEKTVQLMTKQTNA